MLELKAILHVSVVDNFRKLIAHLKTQSLKHTLKLTNWPLIWDKIEEGFKIFWVKYKFYKDPINISFIAFVNKFILAISADCSH